MLERLMVDYAWLGIGLWLLVYLADYQLTITNARLYREGANAFLGIEGSLELTPLYQADVDALRRTSPRALAVMAILSAYLLLLWWLAVSWAGIPELYAGVLGALVLLNATAIMRHLRNLAFSWHGRKGEGLAGRLDQKRWLSLRLSAAEMGSFALLYLALFLVTGSWFLAGGVVSCGITGWKHWSMASKARRATDPTTV
jgi:hypothetical protein